MRLYDVYTGVELILFKNDDKKLNIQLSKKNNAGEIIEKCNITLNDIQAANICNYIDDCF